MLLRPALRFALLGFVLLGAACSPAPPAAAGASPNDARPLADLAPLLGARAARVVWLEEVVPQSPLRQVFGYASAEGGGIRALTTEAADYARPLLNHDGSALVYTRLHASAQGEKTAYAPEIILQPWDGPARVLGPGMAVAWWRDPADGKAYIYALESLLPGSPGRLAGEKLWRFLPAAPEDREIIWTASPLGAESLQISRDGHRAAGLFPFPKAGLANLTDQTLVPLVAGGWPAGASDDSYAAAVLDGSRRRLRFSAPNLDPGWELSFMGAPGWQDGGLLHPRWSNDPTILVFTGPHVAEESAADIALVRLREDFRSIARVVRLTEGRRALSPDLWVEGGSSVNSSLPQQPVVAEKAAPAPWPSSPDNLVFAWDHALRPAPVPSAAASLTPQGFATWGRYQSMDPSGGWFAAEPAAAARLATEAAAAAAFSLELILTERPAAPPLSVRLAALMLEDGREAFALYRVDRKLVLRVLLGGGPERPAQVYPVILTNLAIEAERPVHLLLSLRNNRLSCWLDGQLAQDWELPNSGLAAWGPGQLSFGDPQPYGTPWSGTLDRVALWSRALGKDEARQAAEVAQAWMSTRTRPARIKLKATLAALPALPSLLPQQMLAISVWDVQQVFMGQLEAKRIAIADWSRLQGQPVPSTLPAVGQAVDFYLESWDDHEELEQVPSAAAPGATGLPLYFLSRPLRLPP